MRPATAVIPPLPWLRTLVFSATSVGFAVAAHTSAEGTFPAVWLVALALPAVALLLRPLAGVEQRGASLLAALLGVQLLLHAVFVAGQGRRSTGAAGWLCCGSSGAPAGLAQSATAGFARQGASVQPGHTVVAGHALLGGLSSAALTQLLAHLAAALLLAGLLRRRERSVWAAVRAAGAWLLALVAAALGRLTPSATSRPRRLRPRPPLTVASGLLVTHQEWRRGPPRPAPCCS